MTSALDLWRIHGSSGGLVRGRAALCLPLIPTLVWGKINTDYWNHVIRKLYTFTYCFYYWMKSDYCFLNGDLLGAFQRPLVVLGPQIGQHESSLSTPHFGLGFTGTHWRKKASVQHFAPVALKERRSCCRSLSRTISGVMRAVLGLYWLVPSDLWCQRIRLTARIHCD